MDDLTIVNMLQTTIVHKNFTLLSIDPGLNNVGIAIYEIETQPFKILSIQAFTLKSERLIDDSCLDDEDHTERVHKRYMMGRSLTKALQQYRPDVVASESPFFDRRKPGSFAVLTEVLTTLFDAVVAFNPLIKFVMISPQSVKMTLGVAGIKGKEVVREAMEKQQEIITVLQDPLETIDEHAIDAIAVGYSWIMTKSGLIEKKE